MIVYAIIDVRLEPRSPARRRDRDLRPAKDAERFMEEVGDGDRGLASYLRIEERELEAGGRAG